MTLDWNFHYIGSLEFHWKWTSIGPHNDLALNKRQATIKDQMKAQLTDACTMYASLGFNTFPSKYRMKTMKTIFLIYKNICTTLQHYIHKYLHIPLHTHIHIKIGIYIYAHMYALIYPHFDGSVQDHSNSIPNELELPLPCTKPSICTRLSSIVKPPQFSTH